MESPMESLESTTPRPNLKPNAYYDCEQSCIYPLGSKSTSALVTSRKIEDITNSKKKKQNKISAKPASRDQEQCSINPVHTIGSVNTMPSNLSSQVNFHIQRNVNRLDFSSSTTPKLHESASLPNLKLNLGTIEEKEVGNLHKVTKTDCVKSNVLVDPKASQKKLVGHLCSRATSKLATKCDDGNVLKDACANDSVRNEKKVLSSFEKSNQCVDIPKVETKSLLNLTCCSDHEFVFPQWKNKHSMCWLDVSLCLMVHNHTLKDTVFALKDAGITTILGSVIEAFIKGTALLQQAEALKCGCVSPDKLVRLENSVGTVPVKTGGGDSPIHLGFGRATPVKSSYEKDSLSKDVLNNPATYSTSLYEKCKQLLDNARERVWKYLEPSLRCVLGKNDSPVFALPLLLKDKLKDNFNMKYQWEMNCTRCQYKHIDRVEKPMVTFPEVQPDFSMTTPYFLRGCFKCGALKQNMRMNILGMPQTLLVHFVSGLHSMPPEKYNFSHEGVEYRVKGLIQYSTLPAHFIAWINKDSLWMKCNDMESSRCTFRNLQPAFPASQIHVLMWERQTSSHQVASTAQSQSTAKLKVQSAGKVLKSAVIDDCKKGIYKIELNGMHFVMSNSSNPVKVSKLKLVSAIQNLSGVCHQPDKTKLKSSSDCVVKLTKSNLCKITSSGKVKSKVKAAKVIQPTEHSGRIQRMKDQLLKLQQYPKPVTPFTLGKPVKPMHIPSKEEVHTTTSSLSPGNFESAQSSTTSASGASIPAKGKCEEKTVGDRPYLTAILPLLRKDMQSYSSKTSTNCQSFSGSQGLDLFQAYVPRLGNNNKMVTIVENKDTTQGMPHGSVMKTSKSKKKNAHVKFASETSIVPISRVDDASWPDPEFDINLGKKERAQKKLARKRVEKSSPTSSPPKKARLTIICPTQMKSNSASQYPTKDLHKPVPILKSPRPNGVGQDELSNEEMSSLQLLPDHVMQDEDIDSVLKELYTNLDISPNSTTILQSPSQYPRNSTSYQHHLYELSPSKLPTVPPLPGRRELLPSFGGSFANSPVRNQSVMPLLSPEVSNVSIFPEPSPIFGGKSEVWNPMTNGSISNGVSVASSFQSTQDPSNPHTSNTSQPPVVNNCEAFPAFHEVPWLL